MSTLGVIGTMALWGLTAGAAFFVGCIWQRRQPGEISKLVTRVSNVADQLKDRRAHLSYAARSLVPPETPWSLPVEESPRREQQASDETELRYIFKLLTTHDMQLLAIIDLIENASRRAYAGFAREASSGQRPYEDPRGSATLTHGPMHEARQDPQRYPSLIRSAGRAAAPRLTDDTTPRAERVAMKPSVSLPLQQTLDLYNRAVEDSTARDLFREHYQPLRLTTTNSVQRHLSPALPAEFDTSSDGEFFAIAIPGTDEHWILPRLGLVIEAVSYGAGALGEVFGDTSSPHAIGHHSHYRVRRPAIFRRHGQHWQLLSAGELDLGPSS